MEDDSRVEGEERAEKSIPNSVDLIRESRCPSQKSRLPPALSHSDPFLAHRGDCPIDVALTAFTISATLRCTAGYIFGEETLLRFNMPFETLHRECGSPVSS